jgi:propionyl-CoA synthetase
LTPFFAAELGKAGAERTSGEVEQEAVGLVRDRVGPVASFKTALVVAGLPKTRSGKILRGTMRRIADGEDYPVPATIDDAATLGKIEAALGRAGYGAPATGEDRSNRRIELDLRE